MFVGNCRYCGHYPHDPYCPRADKGKKCDACAGTGVEVHQDGGPCPACCGRGRSESAREKHQREFHEKLANDPKFQKSLEELGKKLEQEIKKGKA